MARTGRDIVAKKSDNLVYGFIFFMFIVNISVNIMTFLILVLGYIRRPHLEKMDFKHVFV
jgi:hypothetical protein